MMSAAGGSSRLEPAERKLAPHINRVLEVGLCNGSPRDAGTDTKQKHSERLTQESPPGDNFLHGHVWRFAGCLVPALLTP
jgi:hypothetical protein